MTLNSIIKRLQNAGIESADFDAFALAWEFCHKPKEWLIINRDTELASSELEAAVLRREMREPLQYIIGKWQFRNETYKVSADCLIPRADSETLVETAIQKAPSGAKILDLCTGSGCLAISTLCERKDCTGIAVDISEAALEIAKYNAEHNKVGNRIEFICADIMRSDFAEQIGEFDIIISNPPYIPTEDIKNLEKELSYEPIIALDGGDDGLVFYRKIISEYLNHLKDGGFMLLEIGYDQAEKLRKTFPALNIEIKKDYGGNDRVAIIQNHQKITE